MNQTADNSSPSGPRISLTTRIFFGPLAGAAAGVACEGVAIVLGVDRLLDMTRTIMNVSGDVTCAAFISRSEGYWEKT